MRTALRIAVTVLLLISAVLACEFKYDSVGVPRYYRAEGWTLPGIDDVIRSDKPTLPYVMPELHPVPNAQARLLAHDDPYVVQFPSQVFMLNGKRQKMHTIMARAAVVRWEMDGNVFAYSYGLAPAQAKKQEGKWVIEVEAGCIFTGTFIDDQGDGVFRLLIPGPLTPDLVPTWANKSKS